MLSSRVKLLVSSISSTMALLMWWAVRVLASVGLSSPTPESVAQMAGAARHGALR
jgi:hypothetical protein